MNLPTFHAENKKQQAFKPRPSALNSKFATSENKSPRKAREHPAVHPSFAGATWLQGVSQAGGPCLEGPYSEDLAVWGDVVEFEQQQQPYQSSQLPKLEW